MKILDHYKKLLNKTENIGEGFLSLPIDNELVFRLAIDEELNPTLLISEDKFDSSGWGKTNFKLDKLELKFNVNCQVRDINTGKELIAPFTIIKQIGGNSRMHDYFLRVVDGIISELRNDLSVARLNSEIQYLVRLFSSPKKVDEKLIQGLWGELLFILASADIENAVTAWHLDRDNLFDFSFDDHSIEVKTTTKNSRSHAFNNNQIKKYRLLKVKVTSIMTEKASLGKSVLDLWNDINDKCSSPESWSKVSRIIAETITQDLDSLSQKKYNYNMGMSTLKTFNAEDIPHITQDCIPPRITEVRVQINLDSI